MADQKQLYQEVILEHNKKPRNFGAVENPNRKAEGHNPVCGDHITLTLDVEGDRIEKIAFTGDSCAICKASASMMTTNIKGKTVEEAENLIQEFRDLATGKITAETPGHHLGRLTVFSGIATLPSRVKCAVLPWHTLHAAFANAENVSTEGSADPAH
ncbi:SUF system NifU family Fe-S cluster assembly protein [bacterium]|nr:SUF system NifU family Fe-S cluster assembly protein [bacterium]